MGYMEAHDDDTYPTKSKYIMRCLLLVSSLHTFFVLILYKNKLLKFYQRLIILLVSWLYIIPLIIEKENRDNLQIKIT